MRGIKLLNFLIAFLLILATSYGLGYFLLEGPLKGNDIPYALTTVQWLNEHLGNQPIWFPLQNAGVSIIQGTQLGAYYLVIFLHRLTGLDLVQSLRLVAFLSFPLAALGIYFYVWHKFKSQTMATIAGVFYLLSQAVWTWLSDVGLFAQGVSFIFIPPTLLFFDFYLESIFKQETGRKQLLYLFLAALFLGLSSFTHFTTGVVTTQAILLYGFLFPLLFAQKNRLKAIFLGVAAAFGVILLAALLFSFWLVPFLRYMFIASRNGTQYMVFENLPYIDLRAIFGFMSREELSQINEMWYAFFALPVAILAGFGIVLSLLRKQRDGILLSFIFVFFLLYAAMPGLLPGLVQKLIFLWANVYVRVIIVPMMVLPILAALGASLLGEFLSFGKKQLVPIMTLIISLLIVFALHHSPPGYTADCYWGFGIVIADMDHCQIVNKVLRPNLSVSKETFPWGKTVEKIVSQLGLTGSERMDISPRLGHIVAGWNVFTKTSILNLFWFPMSLNNIFWGYQQGAFYGRFGFGSPEELVNLAKWFGFESVLLRKSDEPKYADPLEKYGEANWGEVPLEVSGEVVVKKFKNPTRIATWTKRPTVLVLGRFDKRAYEQVFRSFATGTLDYERAMLVEGKDSGRIDDYTLEELKKFDILYLYGYDYKNKDKAYRLIEDYVRGGGNLYIETGWQFVSKDWQAHQTPEVLPLRKLEWRNFGLSWSIVLEDKEIAGDIDVSKFSPPIWYGEPWGVSTAKKESLRQSARTIISVNDYPLVAIGTFGQGKVVWSGMNLMWHGTYYQNETEKKLFTNLISWLSSPLSDSEMVTPMIARDHPDKIEFTFNQSTDRQTSLYFRETYFPDWKAKICNGERYCKSLTVYRAGPNFMLVRIPALEAGSQVFLEIKTPLVVSVSKILSLLTVFGFILLLWQENLALRLVTPIKNLISRGFKSLLEEEE